MASSMAVREAVRHVAPAPSVRGVIFDLDGTLLDSERLYRQAFRDALAVFGRRMDDAAYVALIGLATPDRMALLTERFGPEFPGEAFAAEYRRQKQLYMADGIALKPGAMALLEWLDAQGIPAALATAASAATAQQVLQGVGLRQRFSAIVCRDHVGRRKPYPDAILQAARLLQVDPAECLVLEDSAPGVEAASTAGVIPILIPDVAEVPADVRLKSFAIAADLHAVRAFLAGH